MRSECEASGQDSPERFARSGARNLVQEVDRAGPLVSGELASHSLEQLFGADDGAGTQHDGRSRNLSAHFVVDPEYGTISDALVREENGFDFGGRDLEA